MKTAFLRSLILGAASILLVAASIGCGRTHRTSTHSTSTSIATALAARTGGSQGVPATVPLADVLAQIDAYPAPKGVDATRFASLKAELKKQLAARSPDGKRLSIAPTAIANAVTDLKAVAGPSGAQATVTWTEKLWGDYDNNGVVDIGDLIPLALYYGQRTDSGPDDAHRLVNGDADPEINIWDLGAIAGNYAAHLEGYQVWRGHWNGSSTDWETAYLPNIGNPTNTNWSADRPSPPPVSTRPAYTYTDDISGVADKNNIRYKVAPFGDGGTGPESNEAAVPATTFSVSGKVTLSGNGLAGVTLTLAPGGLHATTQADGTYAISGVANGSYSLTPTATGYVFAPASIPVTVNGTNVLGFDFIATGAPSTHSVSGTVTLSGAGLAGVTMTLTPGGKTATTGADGTFSIGDVLDGTYTLTPYKQGFSFSPSFRIVSVSGADVAGQDFSVYTSGLARTAWPKFHGDERNSGQSPVIASQSGVLKWLSPIHYCSAPVIGMDGTLFVANDSSMGAAISALDPSDGSVKWQHATVYATSLSPAIAKDGTIYSANLPEGMSVGDSTPVMVFAHSPEDGSIIWAFVDASSRYGCSAPAIGPDGTVYVGGPTALYALNPADGTARWKAALNGGYGAFGDEMECPAIGADGTIYVTGHDGATSGDKVYNVYAVNSIDGSVRWKHALDNVAGAPAVGADGTIYVGTGNRQLNSGRVYALAPADGTSRWERTLDTAASTCPAIGADGTVYVGGGKLYALNPSDGTSKWEFNVPSSSAAIGGDGIVYFAGGVSNNEKVYAVKPADGSVLWSYDVGMWAFTSPVIGADGTVYVGIRNDTTSYGLGAFSGPVTYPVSGNVTLYGYGLSGVAVTLSPYGLNAVTLSDGSFTIRGVPDGTYTITPTLSGYTFAPPTQTATVNGRGVTAQEFVAAPVDSYSVSGTVSASGVGLEGVNVALSSYGLSAATASDGTYTISGVPNGTYTLAPYRLGYVFAPLTRNIAVAGSNVTGQDFGTTTGSGLANSPWPKPRGDARNSGLSQYNGAQTSTVKWSFGPNWAWPLSIPPVVGADGTIYESAPGIGSSNTPAYVYAVNPADGSVKWRLPLSPPGLATLPAVGADGTIYVGYTSGFFEGYVYALDPTVGSIKWTFDAGFGAQVDSAPAIGADGSVYIGTYNGLTSLSPVDGSVKWTDSGVVVGYAQQFSPAIGLDGTLYVEDSHGNGSVYAINPSDGSTKWQYGPAYRPAVAPNGDVYVFRGQGAITALNSVDGTVKREYTPPTPAFTDPAMGPDGMIYVGSNDHKVYAIDPAGGVTMWTFTAGAGFTGSPAVGGDGTVYIGTSDGSMYALRPGDGSMLWTYKVDNSLRIALMYGEPDSSPAIGWNNSVVAVLSDGNMYAFGP